MERREANGNARKRERERGERCAREKGGGLGWKRERQSEGLREGTVGLIDSHESETYESRDSESADRTDG